MQKDLVRPTQKKWG